MVRTWRSQIADEVRACSMMKPKDSSMSSELRGLKGYTDGYIFDENENCIGKTYNRDHAKIIADAFERDRNTRAVPDVPKLLTVAFAEQFPNGRIEVVQVHKGRHCTTPLVTRQNAEEVIAAHNLINELSGNPRQLIDMMASAIRADGSDLCDGPWESLSDDRKLAWRGDAERALAAVKEYLTTFAVMKGQQNDK